MSPNRSRRSRPRKRKKQSNNRKLIWIIAFLAIILVIIVVVYSMFANSPSNEDVPSSNSVLLSTNMGDIVIELRDDMPITTQNFKNLVQQGVYDGTVFHRVIDGFMIQGGDPNGNGISGDSIPAIPDEFTGNNRNDRGTIAMANSGPNTGSSQFFINLEDNNNLSSDLNSNHPVFGKVIDGMDVVDTISQVPTDGDPPEGSNKPLEDVTLIKATVIE